MNCDLAKTQFVDLMYEELDTTGAKDLHAHIAECASCKKEFDALVGTRQVLKAIPQEEPQERIIFTATPRRSFSGWLRDARAVLPQTAWGRLSFAVATAALFALVVGSVGNFNMKYDDQGFSVSMGVLPQQSSEISPEVMAVILERARQENAQYTASMIAASEEKQKQSWSDNFTNFALEMDRKRDTELYMIGNQLERMNESTNNQFRELMRSVNYQR